MNEKLQPLSDFESEAEQAKGKQGSPPSSPTFNINQVEGGIVAVGDGTTISGPINVDMSELQSHHVEKQTRPNAQGVSNWKAQFAQLTYAIQKLPNSTSEQKAVFIQLLNELDPLLMQGAAVDDKGAQNVVNRIRGLVREMETAVPDPEMLEITGESLKRAAQKYVDLLPEVVGISDKMVKTAFAMCQT